MQYWPFWMCGIALAGVIVGQWLWTRRLMAVSGRFSALIDGATAGERRVGDASVPSQDVAMSDVELLEALRAATATEFGEDAVASTPVADAAPPLAIQRPQTTSQHLVFLASLAAGGSLSAILAGTFEPAAPLRAVGFAARFGEGGLAYGVLIIGGILVGFGTRMAGGCTSGHGLCGLSRFQPGSALATACFFGMGIVVSLVIGALT